MIAAGPVEDDDSESSEGALSVLRRALSASPELRQGLVATVGLGVAVAIGRLTVPIVIQQALDRPLQPDGSMDVGFIARAAAVAFLIVAVAGAFGWFNQRRLVDRAELAIANLRVRAFEHVHRLSVADHNDTKRGVLVARVTSDAEALARFAQWGLYSWTVNPILIVGILAVLAVYSWQLMLVVVAAYLPVIPTLRWIQRRQIAAYDRYRSRVADMLASFSEAVMGASVIRAYGAERRSRERLEESIERRYRARIVANRYMSTVFSVGDVFSAVAFAGIVLVGLWQREAWGLEPGTIVAALFLANMLYGPVGELAETMDTTQTAVAAWRKILDLVDTPIEIAEPESGRHLDPGPIEVRSVGVGFAYRGGDPVLREVDLVIPAGTNVAVVGATGSGKSTFVKLLCRLADPSEGRIELNGIDLRELAPEARRRSIRMVPQDGFLFETSVGRNVSFGNPAAPEDAIRDSFEILGLGWWLDKLPGGLDSPVGERGENLSVGERQLVALARAQLADPGLLILDEATSAVDPETDQALTTAIQRLAQGRTLISVAHRLATAEAADLVLVFDRGRLVERGRHDELVALDGVYAGLHRAWIGNTRTGAR